MINNLNFKVKRTEHSVLNGSFHTGEMVFDNEKFNYIYDCGANAFPEIEGKVNEYLNKVDKVNLIFVSHLDKDHIIGLKKILNNNKFNNCKLMIPYLDLDDKVILYLSALISENSDDNVDDYIRFLTSPSDYFSEINRIITVNSAEDDSEYQFNNYESEETNNYIFIDQYNNIDFGFNKLDDNKLIKFKVNNNIINWLFLTHVYKKTPQIVKNLKDKIRKSSILNHLLDKNNFLINFQEILNENEKLKELKGIYKETLKELQLSEVDSNGDTSISNLISMSLYSGTYPELAEPILPICYYDCCHYLNKNAINCLKSNRIGWLHTGDANLKDENRRNDFNNHYKKYKRMIEIMSIPHHGSQNNFHIDIMPEDPIYAIIIPNCKAGKKIANVGSFFLPLAYNGKYCLKIIETINDLKNASNKIMDVSKGDFTIESIGNRCFSSCLNNVDIELCRDCKDTSICKNYVEGIKTAENMRIAHGGRPGRLRPKGLGW